ncbi:MAG: hypothetical protein KatS3mg076_2562 [Candidatus Binatia bacterium]|nr:MAG: hypothetical protein KatS3mg076_2562 [Candidatus Binatia bacterium]
MHLPDVDWEVTRPFWDGCRRRELRVPRCRCGTYVWYPQPRCPTCRGREISWVRVSGKATLFTWTKVYRAFLPGYRPPFVTALVELVEDPKLRLATYLRGVEDRKLSLGLPLEVDFEEAEAGIVLPVFRPAE